MSDNTGIEWTDASWNCVTGCQYKSEGCRFCYAARMTRRLEAMGNADYSGLTTSKHFNGVVRTLEHKIDVPLKWRKPRLVFVNSMSDTFHNDVPFAFIDKMFAAMALSQQHTFQVLTKRPEQAAKYFSDQRGTKNATEDFVAGEVAVLTNDPVRAPLSFAWPLSNAWMGTSVESRAVLHRIDALRECPAAVRFLSLEPLLEDLGELNLDGIHWVIVGGESGPGARPCNIEWIRGIIAQCKAAGVPCFVKQLGRNPEWSEKDMQARWYESFSHKKGGDITEWPEDIRVRQMPETCQ